MEKKFVSLTILATFSLMALAMHEIYSRAKKEIKKQ
jgi:hypothetical protein